jgi:predicted secreted acid phosphatase
VPIVFPAPAGPEAALAARKALSDANAAMWGVEWIALPNPMYQSWKSAAGQQCEETAAARWQRPARAPPACERTTCPSR